MKQFNLNKHISSFLVTISIVLAEFFYLLLIYYNRYITLQFTALNISLYQSQ